MEAPSPIALPYAPLHQSGVRPRARWLIVLGLLLYTGSMFIPAVWIPFLSNFPTLRGWEVIRFCATPEGYGFGLDPTLRLKTNRMLASGLVGNICFLLAVPFAVWAAWVRRGPTRTWLWLSSLTCSLGLGLSILSLFLLHFWMSDFASDPEIQAGALAWLAAQACVSGWGVLNLLFPQVQLTPSKAN